MKGPHVCAVNAVTCASAGTIQDLINHDSQAARPVCVGDRMHHYVAWRQWLMCPFWCCVYRRRKDLQIAPGRSMREKEGVHVELVAALTEQEELDNIANQLQRWHRQGYSWADMAVLCRSKRPVGCHLCLGSCCTLCCNL